MKTLILLFAAAALNAATPGELAIANAQREISANPDLPGPHTHLATAYLERARENGNSALYDKADAELRRALSIAPRDYDPRKASVALLLAQQEWTKALAEARALNRQTPDDVVIYGYIADADIALGNLRDAVEQTEWMFRLRPGNPEALIRAARLRQIQGDPRSALEALQMAYDATAFGESGERAWILTQMARVHLESHEPDQAAAAANEALKIFPQYHLALEVLSAGETH